MYMANQTLFKNKSEDLWLGSKQSKVYNNKNQIAEKVNKPMLIVEELWGRSPKPLIKTGITQGQGLLHQICSGIWHPLIGLEKELLLVCKYLRAPRLFDDDF